jgi:O-antigen/teichoic acid export membrane protein
MSVVSASLERRALSLGTANAVDFALQFLLPVVLTRTLDAHAFGQYRLLWLAVATLMAITPMCMGQSLYYFLPRSDRTKQRLFINQAMLFLLAAGLLSAWVLSTWNPLLPHNLDELVDGHGALVPAFILMWTFASLLDVLPAAEERVAWQARAIMSLSALRAASMSAAAILTHDLGTVLVVLAAFAALKAGLVV